MASGIDGLTVSGTSIRNYDIETSAKKKIYASKVKSTLERLKISTKQGSISLFDDIRSKAFPTSGRINKNTTLLKTYNEGDK